MTLRLRNTLTRAVEPVLPVHATPGEPDRIRMYSCGPTVYRYAHVGNLRTFLLADLIRRVLLYHGLEVLHVQNITDVGHLRDERLDRGEDRMLVAAKLENKSPEEIAAAYEASFHADAALLNLLPAHAYPRATEHIGAMVAMTERLVDAGFAYATPNGTVYFEVKRFPGYGKLSGNSLDELRAGHRVEVEPDKRDPADFALWKHAGDGRLMKWRTARWGEGFPGWHIECSAMSREYLGDEFEVHTGGIDNVFPHHEDEIAQSEALSGTVPARLFVHGEHLLLGGRRMAKSAGNFQRITELVEDGFDPLAFRYLCLTSRYGRKLNLSTDSLRGAGAALESLRARLRALGPAPASGPWAAPPPLVAGASGPRPEGVATGPRGQQESPDPALDAYPIADRTHLAAAPLSDPGRALHDRLVAALDDDLDMPRAVATVREIVRAPQVPDDEKRWLALDADAVLGLDLHRVWDAAPGGKGAPPRSPSTATSGLDAGTLDVADLPPGAAALLAERSAARTAHDYARADALRDELVALGVDVIDRPGGASEWRLRG
jgi:cysteinyl-tRNA synthetase